MTSLTLPFGTFIAVLAYFLIISETGESRAAVLSAPANGSSCRCGPTDPCWPSTDDWNSFNASIGGHLQRLRPVGYVCHEPTFDEEACADVIAATVNGTWRAEQPNAMQYFNWEDMPSRNEICNPGTSETEEPCGQGRIPLYSAVAESVEDVQEAVRFARNRNLPLVIKNTGHDSGGRSSRADSFQIFTNRLKGITFYDNFQPAGNEGEPTDPEGPAVTVGGGISTEELYFSGAERGYAIVAGQRGSIGIAGGYVLGAGFSPKLGMVRGLVADLVLQFEVVTAEGEVVIANDYQNTDLFWALRGGGGGTFGIVTKATFRVFPDLPVVVTTTTLTFQLNESESYWNAVTNVASIVRTLSNGEFGAEYSVGRIAQNDTEVYSTTLLAYFLGETDTAAADGALAPLLDYLQSDENVVYEHESEYFEKISTYLVTETPVQTIDAGLLQASNLVSNDYYHSPDGITRMVDSLSRFEHSTNLTIGIHVTGGQINANGDIIDSAIGPGWRSSAVLIDLLREIPQTIEAQLDAQRIITNYDVPLLMTIGSEPHGVYVNQADPNQENTHELFWGAKYDRLYEIKQTWDSSGLFWVNHGVGIEDWDADGWCRV
ncbi:hypothetical protein FQN54_002768 [Arachnomyces sp. PD_36]|nr:hypothetical protein FQN54_002768 [Arachnomyces sp. PD_36]